MTTHRLDIYDEALAKTQFLEEFENLFSENNCSSTALSALPSAYDYIRLGHPLSSILEWTMAKFHHIDPDNVISFSSQTMPIYAILRENLLKNKNTHIFYRGDLPPGFDSEVLQQVYGYQFTLKKVEKLEDISNANIHEHKSTIYLSTEENISQLKLPSYIDFFISIQSDLGSILMINGVQNKSYISHVQHVRRRETIAMTPTDALACITSLLSLIHI